VGRVRQKKRKKKIAGRNNGPARQHYWASNKLEQHKVKALMRDTGMTRAEATVYWRAARGGRRMKSKGAPAVA
jgi:hypothetical protein